MTELPIRPMLACKAPANLTFPLYASPKLDGIRAIVHKGVALSRTGKPIPNLWVQEVLNRPCFDGIDGELIVGSPTDPNVMQNTMSGIMTREGRPEFTFCAFDYFGTEHHFNVRWLNLLVWGRTSAPEARVLHQHLIEDQDALDRYEESCLAQGYEGVMLRSQQGLYKHGRSTAKEGYLMKLKRFDDGEAEIVGAEELLKNDNELTTDELGYAKRSHHQAGKVPMGTLGALVVRDLVTGQVFGIGTGFTQAQRLSLWTSYQQGALTGKLVKYKHFAKSGVKDAPRFPVFIGFRDPIDL